MKKVAAKQRQFSLTPLSASHGRKVVSEWHNNLGRTGHACERKSLVAGFTLVEILISVAIFFLVATAVFNVFFLGQKIYYRGENQAEILQNGRIISERLVREIRQAEEIATPLPQIPTSPDNPPPIEIEFQDGHIPSPYGYLNSDYYYIRFFLSTSTNEVFRQYRVYCFDSCDTCNTYFRWNDTRLEGGSVVRPHACNLEEKLVGEYVNTMEFWGSSLVNVSLVLKKGGEILNLQTKVFGRNI